MVADMYQTALATALGRDPKDAGVAGEPMIAAIAHAGRVARLEAESDKMRSTMDAAIRILSDDRFPLQSRVNDARAILSR